MTPDLEPARTDLTVREGLGFSDAVWRHYTAIWQAGHAVTALVDPDTTFQESAIQDADATGPPGHTDLSSTSKRGMVVVQHAGFYAAERWLRELHLDTPLRIAASRATATHNVQQIKDSGLSPLGIQVAGEIAQGLINDNWPAVVAVAGILDAQGSITATEARLAHGRAMAMTQETPVPALLAPHHLARLDALTDDRRTRATPAETGGSAKQRPAPRPLLPQAHAEAANPACRPGRYR